MKLLVRVDCTPKNIVLTQADPASNPLKKPLSFAVCLVIESSIKVDHWRHCVCHRVWGTRFAEVPFVVTKEGYRRDGNLKILMQVNPLNYSATPSQLQKRVVFFCRRWKGSFTSPPLIRSKALCVVCPTVHIKEGGYFSAYQRILKTTFLC
jgi:hypothetical protein